MKVKHQKFGHLNHINISSTQQLETVALYMEIVPEIISYILNSAQLFVHCVSCYWCFQDCLYIDLDGCPYWPIKEMFLNSARMCSDLIYHCAILCGAEKLVMI